MFLKKIKSPGIAHLSYILGDQGRAAVIDPRRDCEIYLQEAGARGCCVTHIFETHRNEDYVVGSVELARMTGAQIYHGAGLPFAYGQTTRQGDIFELGNIRLQTIETPGHTFESISLVLFDKSYGQEAIGVFTGDALFIGDVGRTDFFPEQLEKMAALLYDSLFNRILPLGDQVMVFPAHGAGSVCGSAIADREFSTLGYEKRNNPVLKVKDRDEFIKQRSARINVKPPYFSRMEEYNLSGPPALGCCFMLLPMNIADFEQAVEKGMQILDIRSAQAFAGVHIPGSISIPLAMVPLYAGWFLSYQKPVGLVAESVDHLEPARRYLARIGYDRISGYLGGGLSEWETQGRNFQSIKAVYAGDIQKRISSDYEFILLDVRTEREFNRAHLPGARHIFLGELEKRLHEIDPESTIITFCGSGQRAIIAASILKRNGFENVENCFGSLQACAKGVCDLVSSE